MKSAKSADVKSGQAEMDNLGWLDPQLEVAKQYAIQAREFNLNPDLMRVGVSRIGSVLKQLNFEQLRTGQSEAVLSLISQKDTYCVLPTGGGKSAIYIVPTVCMGWRTLIFSPLISLITDQVRKLRQFSLRGGSISGGQTAAENDLALMNWETGDLKFLLVAPERLENQRFMDVMRRTPPDMVVVDEAHCISQWGDSFRPQYARLGSDFIAKVRPKVLLSLTATATAEVEQDIRSVLGMQQARRVIYYPTRKNLKHVTKHNGNMDSLLDYVEAANGSTIVYCATRKKCEELHSVLSQHITGGALVYHGGMTMDQRSEDQAAFMQGQTRVMFATNAFGMGVDKNDIRSILHWDVPGSLEALVQEQGRAGRDGLDARCVMFWSEESLGTAQWLIDTEYPAKQDIERVFHAICSIANAQGVVQITSKDLAQKLRLNDRVVGSSIGILTGCKVLARAKDEQNPMKVKILRDHPDEQFQVLLNVVREHGVAKENGYFEINQSVLESETKLKAATIMTKIRALAAEAYVEYTLPFRGKTTQITGKLGLVPFQRIADRRLKQMDKLDVVRDFIHIADHKKHEYLRGYFGIEDHET